MDIQEKNVSLPEFLRSRSQFLSVQKENRKWVAGTMVVQAKKNGLASARFGITVSKKTAPRAVDRNRIKRRLREVIRGLYPDISGTQEDIVIIARAKALRSPFDQLKKDLAWSLKRLKSI